MVGVALVASDGLSNRRGIKRNGSNCGIFVLAATVDCLLSSVSVEPTPDYRYPSQ